MSVKEDIERTYEKFKVIFSEENGESLEHLEMSQVRD